MLQRAETSAYSWWWASHIRSKQSKWLENNLREMEDTVNNMLKLVETDADSFAKRAELYFKRRPELIGFVEDAYKAYRALADKFDRLSGELQKANHTIAVSCPEHVQYAMLEYDDDENCAKAFTPVHPSRINKITVEGLMKRRRESEESIKKLQDEKTASEIDEAKAQEEINKLQKGILALESQKEFIKTFYENGIAKYWELEKQIVDMQEEIIRWRDDFSTSAVIEDDEQYKIMIATTLKSCEDAIGSLQEQRKESIEQVKVESERSKIAKEKLRALKKDCCDPDTVSTEVSTESSEINFISANMEKETDSLRQAKGELQAICEKIKEYLEMDPESSAEVAAKINELLNIIVTLKLTVSSQAAQINRLSSDNNELETNLQNLEEEKMGPMAPTVLDEKVKEAEELISRLQAVEKLVVNEEANFCNNLIEIRNSMNGISERLSPPKPLVEDPCTEHESLEEKASNLGTEPLRELEDKEVEILHIKEDELEDKEVKIHDIKEDELEDKKLEIHDIKEDELQDKEVNIHDIKEDENEDIHVTQPLVQFLEGFLQTEADSSLYYTSEKIEDPMVTNTFGEKGSAPQEVEKRREDYIREMVLLIGELVNVTAMRDEEIQCLRKQLASLKSRPRDSVVYLDTASMNKDLELEMPADLKSEVSTQRDSSVQDINVDCVNEEKATSPMEDKSKRDINSLLGNNLEFWLRFSTTYHYTERLKAKYAEIQTDISKLEEDKLREANDTAAGYQEAKPESEPVMKRLRDLKGELQVWSEQSILLRGELQRRFLSLNNMKEELSCVVSASSTSGEAKFTSQQAAKLKGEVMDMKHETHKASNELLEGLDQVRNVQSEIELQLAKLYENFQLIMLRTKADPSKTGVPLRTFLYGSKPVAPKPKKPSLFARILPLFQKHKRRAARPKIDVEIMKS